MVLKSKAIGGYFELELPTGNNSYYPNALKYNSARSAFYALLLHCKPKRIWIPYYICDSMLLFLKETNIQPLFYSINLDFSIKEKIDIKNSDLLLYINYFGLCSDVQNNLLKTFNQKQIIFDHSQAFFIPPKDCLATLYSPRKFFGIPDGGLLITSLPIKEPSIVDNNSINRSIHLLKRLSGEPEDGYTHYHHSEESLNDITPRKMSLLTERLLSSIDYKKIKARRESNFQYLHSQLDTINLIKMPSELIIGPMLYPFLYSRNTNKLKNELLKERFFSATYWPECERRVHKNSTEYKMIKNMLPLPCDQRYNQGDMKRINAVLHNHLI